MILGKTDSAGLHLVVERTASCLFFSWNDQCGVIAAIIVIIVVIIISTTTINVIIIKIVIIILIILVTVIVIIITIQAEGLSDRRMCAKLFFYFP